MVFVYVVCVLACKIEIESVYLYLGLCARVCERDFFNYLSLLTSPLECKSYKVKSFVSFVHYCVLNTQDSG